VGRKVQVIAEDNKSEPQESVTVIEDDQLR
jgi:hypothetical protein